MYFWKSREAQLSAELFKNPTSEYRGAPFWAWNSKLECEELSRQIRYSRKWASAASICT